MSSRQFKTPNDDGKKSLKAPYQPKRQLPDTKESSLSASSSNKKKKTRSVETIQDGRIKSPWEKDLPVMVNCYDEHGNQHWKEGKVDDLEDSSELGQYRIRVVVKDDNGDWVIPRTFKEHNMDAIPSNHPQLGSFIRKRNVALDGAPEPLKRAYNCIEYHSSNVATDINANRMQELDIVGQLLFNDDPKSPTAIQNLLLSLMDHDDVKQIVSAVTGNETVSVQFALAYIMGQLCGIEVNEAASVDELPPQQLLDKLVASNSTNDIAECPVSQVFLMSNMTARTKKFKKFHPSTSLYDHTRKDVLGDPQKLKTRLKRLQTALAAIHASQYELPRVSGPSSALLLHGIQLMLNMRGTSDMMLDKLADDGVCRPAKVIRYWIQKLADSIDPLTSRTQIPDMSHVLCHTADNADFHLIRTCKSVVPGGNILLGMESLEDSDHFNKEYMKGLGNLSSVNVEQLFATKEEDAYAKG